VPADASPTREQLIAAAEDLFATQGIEAAQLRDIVRAAGQANDSAVHYHFGSRYGLLVAIVERHIAAMEPERRALLDELRERGATGDLAALVTALVIPTVRKLDTAGGRHFLRITAQLAGRVGLQDDGTPAAVLGTALYEELTLLRATCARLMPMAIAVDRIESMIFLFTAALAERARRIDDGERLALDQPTFTANLIAMWVGALGAPWPPEATDVTPRRRRTSRSTA
jgi:AcrR family transcriptional regulator